MNQVTKQFFQACKDGDMKLAQSLAETDPHIDICALDECGWASIHWAAIRGHAEIVAGILSAGIDINIATSAGQTVFHKAAVGGHHDLLNFLIWKGIDKNRKDNFGKTALNRTHERLSGIAFQKQEFEDPKWVSWKACAKDLKPSDYII